MTDHDAELRRLRAENAALAQQVKEQKQLLGMLEDSLDGIWDWNILTGDDYLSPRWKRMLGYEPEELTNHVDTWLKLLHPDDVAIGYAAVNAHWERGEPYEIVLRYHRKDGALAWMLARGKAIRDESGTWVRMAGTHTDLTPLKRTEEELRRSQTRFRNMFDGAAIPLIEEDLSVVAARLDAISLRGITGLSKYLAERPEEMAEIAGNARMLAANRVALELFEAASLDGLAELIGSLWRRMPPALLAEGLTAVAERRPYFKAEMEVDVGSRGPRSVILTLTIEDASAQIFGRMGLLDITERKQAEHKIHELNLELERRVEQRTAELTTANKELESFAYTVSHDLRAPLRAIQGFSSLLEQVCGPSLDPRATTFLERIRANTHQMSRLIDDLLALSRVIRLSLRKDTVDLSALAHELLAELKERDPGRVVEAIIQDGMAVHADPGLIRIVINNLLENAWKFTNQCDIARIELGRQDDHTYFLKDNGVGFSMEYADKLFGPFQRLHQEDEFPGNGIGLATVERIIRRHGGRIWGSGEVGVGATFYFELESALG